MTFKIYDVLQLIVIVLLFTLQIIVMKTTDTQLAELNKITKTNAEYIQNLEVKVQELQKESNQQYFMHLENTSERCD